MPSWEEFEEKTCEALQWVKQLNEDIPRIRNKLGVLERKLVETWKKAKKIHEEVNEAKIALMALCKEGISDSNQDEFERLRDKMDQFDGWMALCYELQTHRDELVRLEEKNHKKRLKPSMGKPKQDVIDVVVVKEELLQQVGTEPKTSQTLELEAVREAGLEARKRLINMTEFLEERRQEHYKALVQVEEHLEHIEDEIVEMRTLLEDFHGKTAELEEPKDVADVEDVMDELDKQVGSRPCTLQALLDDSHEDDMKTEEMKDELVTQVEPRQDTLQALVVKPHGDVANVTMIKEELDEQVVPGSNTSKALMRMEDAHLRSLHGDMTCVSWKHKEDGTHMGMRKKMTSLPTPLMTNPRMPAMRPCTLMEQGTWDDANLVGAVCDLTLDGSNAQDKGGT